MKSIIIKYSKYILTLLAVAAMAVGLLMPAQIKAADSYNKDKKGSITINLDDVKQGIIASKIAAHAADIAKGVRGARDIDDKMGDARRVLDWDAQWECALDPETAKAIRADRAPEHEDTCSMCGKFCAVRSMNKALNGEHIDIL